MEQIGDSLDGQLLIAMPGMGDPRFEKSVVFMCAHSEDGALGLIINKPTREIRFQTLLEQLDLAVGPAQRDIRVHFGGPVENERGFVLHSSDYRAEAATLEVSKNFGMTATLAVLEELARVSTGRGFSPGGFFSVDHSGFTGTLAVLATYIVVLAQFRAS